MHHPAGPDGFCSLVEKVEQNTTCEQTGQSQGEQPPFPPPQHHGCMVYCKGQCTEAVGKGAACEGFQSEKGEPTEEKFFQKGIDKSLKKVGEESTEVIIAGKANDKPETIYELADLAYHALVLMVEMGITVEDVHRELASRHIIDHKVKQEKMK